MFFSFFTRTPSKAPTSIRDVSVQKEIFKHIVEETEGSFFFDFKLFHRDTVTRIDLLFFFPHRGLYVGEKLSWNIDDLKGASVERASRRSKKEPATRLETTQAKIHLKLQDVLSFDSTVCERFFWMDSLSEEEFDSLDSSFHELLPKSRLIFCNESVESLREKFEAMSDYLEEPYSATKIIGSLNAHTLLLPTPDTPFGTLLSDEQYRFLELEPTHSITMLIGGYGSGKSTALIRKALLLLLNHPMEKILIITPTLLSGELLRDEIVSLMEYGAVQIDLSKIAFFSPYNLETPIHELKIFQEASTILCDDAELMEERLRTDLIEKRGNRRLLLAALTKINAESTIIEFTNRYRSKIDPLILDCDVSEWKYVLMQELRKRLDTASEHDIMVIIPEDEPLLPFKETLDEYLGIACKTVTPEFSLQYGNLDGLIIMSSDTISTLCIPHLYLAGVIEMGDYSHTLSRASESATIISYSNPHGESDE